MGVAASVGFLRRTFSIFIAKYSSVFPPFWCFVCGFGFFRRPRKLGIPGISEGPEKEGEEGPDEKSAVRILLATTARKCIKCI